MYPISVRRAQLNGCKKKQLTQNSHFEIKSTYMHTLIKTKKKIVVLRDQLPHVFILSFDLLDFISHNHINFLMSLHKNYFFEVTF